MTILNATSTIPGVTNPYSPTAVAITGGTIDGAAIGGTTKAAGGFTTLSITGQAVFSSGSALATSATSGFVYIPTCAGVPTGTPGAQTGAQPLVIDTTDGRLYFYSGSAWTQAGGGGSAPPSANLLGGTGSTFTSVTVSTGLTLSGGNLSVTNPYAPTAVAITGGTIDGTAIGATTASTLRGTTLTLTTSQTANQVYAAPSGSSGAPSFRALTTADIPIGAPVTYTASGAIALTDPFSFVNSASAVTMTVASGTTNGQRLNINNIGAGAATISLTLQGAAATPVLATGNVLNLIWNSASWYYAS